jgi:hypothetical protein
MLRVPQLFRSFAQASTWQPLAIQAGSARQEGVLVQQWDHQLARLLLGRLLDTSADGLRTESPVA